MEYVVRFDTPARSATPAGFPIRPPANNTSAAAVSITFVFISVVSSAKMRYV